MSVESESRQRRSAPRRPAFWPRPSAAGYAPVLHSLLGRLLGRPPVFRLECWDGSVAGPDDAALHVTIRTPQALRRMLWRPDELGLARAFVSGDITADGDVASAFAAMEAASAPDEAPPRRLPDLAAVFRVAWQVGALGLPPAPPASEARLHGGLHTRRRDAAAVSHHYDVGNEFYRLLLGESMVYSCAYWRDEPSPSYSLFDAQTDKLDLVARKLGLEPGLRLLDIGCGWGSMLLHAASHYGVRGVGVTLSKEQAVLARQRVAEAGLSDTIDIRVCDYRDLADGPYDAISSIGMAEHVGLAAFADYAKTLNGLLRPGGRLLNHQISKPHGPRERHQSPFIARYVFPDGELLPISDVVGALERGGFEIRDVESIREHYAHTLRAWLANLEARYDEARAMVGEERARVWRLYIAASAASFTSGRISVHQTLAVKRDRGRSGMPLTRERWLWAVQEPTRTPSR